MIPLSNNQGSLLLFVSSIIFIGCLAAAGFTWYYLHQSAPISPASSPTPVNGGSESVLHPLVEIDPLLTDDQAIIQKNLITPLRQHYATREERLVAVRVAPHDDETYPIEVVLTLRYDATEEKVSFLYDLSPWNPSLLEQHSEDN